ncbi:MAG: hypothetical protein QG588_710, partial [Candidatus Poribacteria bacterium]|nr:hypothetical protein [Candidatus Poribacteria bacterium]
NIFAKNIYKETILNICPNLISFRRITLNRKALKNTDAVYKQNAKIISCNGILEITLGISFRLIFDSKNHTITALIMMDATIRRIFVFLFFWFSPKEKMASLSFHYIV